jgi:hypothetical protein
MKKGRRPASKGEEAAIRGFGRQFEYAACAIYDAMQGQHDGAEDKPLTWVGINDEGAGIFDDVLICVGETVFGTQIKTSESPATVNLRTQLIENGLIEDLLGSWRQLKNNHPTLKVRARFIFSGYFSSRDNLCSGEANVNSREFATGLAKKTNTEDTSKQPGFSEFIGALRDKAQVESGLEWDAFIDALELFDREALAGREIGKYPAPERAHLKQIRDLLPQLVKDASGKVTWNQEELLGILGWRPKAATNQHVFPIDGFFSDNYQTEKRILEIIRGTQSGYLSLTGGPGTGKSSLLQRSVNTCHEFLVTRYLAFIPDKRADLGRAETVHFLNDVGHGLSTLGFRGNQIARERDDLANLRGEFVRQLDEASKNFKASGQKTIIIVDGLDHVPREETPTESFLRELPGPADVPEGVLILLGTQTVELVDLKPAIRQQAQRDDRRAEITPLSQAAIFEIADLAELPEYVSRPGLFEASSGHPLTVRYLVNALQAATDAESADAILSEEEGIGRHVEEIYDRIWESLNAETDGFYALGLIARSEGPIRLEDLAKRIEESTLDGVLHKAGFVLRVAGKPIEAEVFHNSFRLFVIRRTASRFGERSEQKEKEFNAALADIATACDVASPQRWNELRYRARAGQSQKVSELATPEYFRERLRRFHPVHELLADLRLVYRASIETDGPLALISKLFIEKEIDYRTEATRDLDLIDLFISFNDVDLAVRHALEGEAVHPSWGSLVDQLYEGGDQRRAQQIFDELEPLELLLGLDNARVQDHFDELREWAQQAPRFRPIERLLETIEGLRVESPIHKDRDDSAEYQAQLRFCVAKGALDCGEVNDVDEAVNRFDLSDLQRIRLLFETANRLLNQQGDRKAALDLINSVPDDLDCQEVGASWMLLGARIVHELGESALATQFLSCFSIPSLKKYKDGYGSNIARGVRRRYELAIWNERLGLNLSVENSPARSMLNALERQIDEMAKLRVLADCRDDSSAITRMRSLVAFFTAFRADGNEIWLHQIAPVYNDLGELIMSIAHKLGDAVFNATVREIDRAIKASQNPLGWSLEFQIGFTLAAYSFNLDEASALTRLNLTRQMLGDEDTPQEAVDRYSKLAKAYVEIGREDLGWELLSEMHSHTCGYWLAAKKEPQYLFWSWVYRNACQSASGKTSNFACHYARFILGLDQTEGYDTGRRIVDGLLISACGAPSAAAAILDALADSTMLVSWQNLAQALLSGVVQHNPDFAEPCLVIFGELVIPYWAPGEADAFLSTVFKSLDGPARDKEAHRLLNKIEKWSPVRRRRSLVETLLNCGPFSLDVTDRVDDFLINTDRQESLLREHYPEAPANTFGTEYKATSLKALAQTSDGKSNYGSDADYNYSVRACELMDSASAEEIEEFCESSDPVRNDLRIQAAATKRMLILGKRNRAIKLLSRADALAEGGSWSHFLGGQKLNVQELKVELFGDSAKRTGLERLKNELASGTTRGSYLFMNLEDVLEVVCVDLDFEAVWHELAEHLRQYREFQLAKPLVPDLTVSSHSQLVARLLTFATSLAGFDMTDQVRAAILDIAEQPAAAQIISDLAVEFIQTPEGAREIAALLKRLIQHDHLRGPISRMARQLVDYPDFVVSVQAGEALRSIGETVEEPLKELPSFYAIEIPEDPRAQDFRLPPGTTPTSRAMWSEDRWTWTSGMSFPFKLLADASGLSLEQLRLRCAELMRSEFDAELFGPAAENQARRRLERLDLRMTYSKLQPVAANRAFGRMLKELADADAFDLRVMSYIWGDIGGPILRSFEPTIEARPTWIDPPALPHRENVYLSTEDWLGGTNLRASIPISPTMFVLAERSDFTFHLDRKRHQSWRFILPGHQDWDRLDTYFSGMRSLVGADAYGPNYEAHESRLVATVPRNLYGDLRGDTITLCPFTARTLGWRRTVNNPLRLVDATGELVAETIIWRQGVDVSGKMERDITARGEVLLVTSLAKRQIESAFGSIILGTKVLHMIDDEDGNNVRSAVFLGQEPQL